MSDIFAAVLQRAENIKENKLNIYNITFKVSFLKKDTFSCLKPKFAKMFEIKADRAVLITESYRTTEGQPIVLRRAKAFAHILENLPITIRPEELIVGSNSIAPRGCQVFPEYSYEWLEAEFDTVSTRTADPFYISEETKAKLREVYPYWKGKTTSELATSYMSPEALTAIEHNHISLEIHIILYLISSQNFSSLI